jgi:protein-disulfide isomerase
MREAFVRVTRREFCEKSATLAIAAAVLGGAASLDGFFHAALAQDAHNGEKKVSMDDLLKASKLPTKSLGKADAPVKVLEYASLTCPHCAHFENTAFPELKKRYIDTGKVYYIFRELPLNKLDLVAMMVARCTADDQYFPFIETLFRTQDDWVVQQGALGKLQNLAKQVGISDDKFKACVSDQKTLDSLMNQRDEASKFGTDSTPTFFINGAMYNGDMPIERVAQIIDPLLKG